MTTRISDEQVQLEQDPNAGCVPTDTYPRRDPREPDPAELPEVDWRGVQNWICAITASWQAAQSFYVIDWGDGKSEIAHPDMRNRTHTYSTHSVCNNLTNTVTIRPLYRDGTTGAAVARSVVQARGWGAPQHDLELAYNSERKVNARLFRRETPLGYGIAWDPDTIIEHLPDGESRSSHEYGAGPSRRPMIGVLDRPARRLRWFSGPMINSRDVRGMDLTASFGVSDEWDGGYSGKLSVTNHTDDHQWWVVEFTVDKPGVLREVWPSPTTHMRDLSMGRWRVWSTNPIPANSDVTVGMRIEPPGEPNHWPYHITANPQPQTMNDDATKQREEEK